MIILIAVFPGALITGPFYNLLAILSMLLGIYTAYKLFNLKDKSNKTTKITLKKQTIQVTAATILGVVFRAGLMTAVNYVVLRYEPPIGYAMPEAAIVAAIPLIALFNSTLALYTIPIGHIVANAVKKNLKL
jgi:disulfide bond formation protein DsbB